MKVAHWWLYLLQLSWVRFGIYTLYLFFRRISRIDAFSRRKQAYHEALVEWTEREATARGKDDEVHDALVDLGSEIHLAYGRDLRPIRAGLSLVLTIVTFGIYGLFVLYRKNRYWWEAEVVEQDFDDKLSQVWMRLGIVCYPLTARVT